MSAELDRLAQLRRIATDPAARGLMDDAALLDGLVLTHDTIVEGVHFLSHDPPASVAAKLVAVNLSDLAAKGARPRAMMLSLAMDADAGWDAAFLGGIAAAQARWGCALIGGDTVALPPAAPRVLGLTMIGTAGARTPGRDGARPGDGLWLAGTLGDAGAGLALLQGDAKAEGPLVDAYRTPRPWLAAGQALAPQARAMMDVSDGLLIDALRMAEASGVALAIDLSLLPLSPAFVALRGEDRAARLFAASAGDDYALLAAVADADAGAARAAGFVPIGSVVQGAGVMLSDAGAPVSLPERLGWLHEV